MLSETKGVTPMLTKDLLQVYIADGRVRHLAFVINKMR